MSVKELQTEFVSLKSEFTDLKDKIDTLVNKYENLEKRYEKCMSRKKKSNFKCRKCDEVFETLNKLKMHKNDSCVGSFKCEECDQTFKEESQLNEHKKKHTKFPCDECDKVYNFEGTLEKHKSACHEEYEIFCYFYNNNKDCPYDDQCIYMHEESEDCKFGKSCERKMCMYRHDDAKEESDDEDESESSDDEEEDESLEELKPVLKKIQEAVDKFEVMLKKCSLKCDDCDFEARNQNGLSMHIKAKHTKQ